MTTLESQMAGKPRSDFKFVRSTLDHFFAAISWLFAGILLLSIIGLSWFVEVPFFVTIAIFAVSIALGIWGTVILGFPYENRFDIIGGTIHRNLRLLVFWRRRTIPKERVVGLEVRTYLNRDNTIKEWEFWLVVDQQKKGQAMKFIARTRYRTKADKWAKALKKRFGLQLLS
jgi:hypothetical protein